MTSMLACDGCGQIVQERGEGDPTRLWWALSQGPSIEQLGPLPIINLQAWVETTSDDDEPVDLHVVEPVRHFCSEDCIRRWIEGRQPADIP